MKKALGAKVPNAYFSSLWLSLPVWYETGPNISHPQSSAITPTTIVSQKK